MKKQRRTDESPLSLSLAQLSGSRKANRKQDTTHTFEPSRQLYSSESIQAHEMRSKFVFSVHGTETARSVLLGQTETKLHQMSVVIPPLRVQPTVGNVYTHLPMRLHEYIHKELGLKGEGCHLFCEGQLICNFLLPVLNSSPFTFTPVSII